MWSLPRLSQHLLRRPWYQQNRSWESNSAQRQRFLSRLPRLTLFVKHRLLFHPLQHHQERLSWWTMASLFDQLCDSQPWIRVLIFLHRWRFLSLHIQVSLFQSNWVSIYDSLLQEEVGAVVGASLWLIALGASGRYRTLLQSAINFRIEKDMIEKSTRFNSSRRVRKRTGAEYQPSKQTPPWGYRTNKSNKNVNIINLSASCNMTDRNSRLTIETEPISPKNKQFSNQQ